MKLSRQQKVEKSAAYSKEFEGATQFFFADYTGLGFKGLHDLRSKLAPLDFKFKVVKNSIARHAVEGAGLKGAWDDIFAGPVAMGHGKSPDASATAKVLVNFQKDNPKLKIKAAFVDGAWMTPAQITELSKLGSKPELLSQLAGTMQQPMSKFASLLQAPMRDFVLLLTALETKKKAETK